MKLLVGLGNYPRKYKDTYHNIGYWVVDHIAENLGLQLKKKPFIGIKYALCDRTCIIAKPHTFMNTSGQVVKKMLVKYGVDIKDLVVVHDDLSLPMGVAKMRLSGGTAGHNGIRSIVDSLGREDFARMRVGIGRPEDSAEFADFVLSPVLGKEKGIIFDTVIPRIYHGFLLWKEQGNMAAMNYINSPD